MCRWLKAYRRPALAAHKSCKVTPRHAHPFSSRSHAETIQSDSLLDVEVYPLFPQRCPLLLVLSLRPSFPIWSVCPLPGFLSLRLVYNPEIWARIIWNSKLRGATGDYAEPRRKGMWTPVHVTPRNTYILDIHLEINAGKNRLPVKSKSRSDLLDFRATE